MKEPCLPPRLSESDDPLIARVVRAAKSDEPSAARLEDAAARFRASRAVARGAAPVAAARRPLLPIMAGVAVVMVAALGVTWSQQRSSDERRAGGDSVNTSTPLAMTSAAAAPVADDSAPSAAMTTPPSDTVPVEKLPVAKAAPPAAKSAVAPNAKVVDPSRSSASSAVTSPSAFDDELALVERARRLLVQGDTAGCLAELDRHQQRIRGGVFDREVGVMRIEALVVRGDLARARALGQAFVAQNPDSPYADRVRSLLAQAGAK